MWMWFEIWCVVCGVYPLVCGMRRGLWCKKLKTKPSPTSFFRSPCQKKWLSSRPQLMRERTSSQMAWQTTAPRLPHDCPTTAPTTAPAFYRQYHQRYKNIFYIIKNLFLTRLASLLVKYRGSRGTVVGAVEGQSWGRRRFTDVVWCCVV